MTNGSSSQVTGFAAAWCIVLVWSFWLIVSRVADKSGLTIYDLAAMRYGLASIVAVPLCLYYKPWQTMRISQMAILSAILGPLYILIVFSGFLYAPAAHGGIFMNGVLPLISMLFALVFPKTLPRAQQVLGAVLIGAVLLSSVADQGWDVQRRGCLQQKTTMRLRSVAGRLRNSTTPHKELR